MQMTGAALWPSVPPTERNSASRGVFVDVENEGVTWTMRAEDVDELLPAVGRLASEGRVPRTAETVKTGPHRTVYRLELATGEFYLKHFRIADTKALLQNAVRHSKAEREWRAARRIARLGLPTFEAVALGRSWRGGIVRDSFLVSRGIPQSNPLDQFVSAELVRHEGTAPPRATACRQSGLRQKLAVALGKLAARLHLSAVAHADFHAGNVLIRIAADDSLQMWLIDLHNVHFRRALTAGERSQSLAQLHQFFVGKSTPSDRLRFYRAYRGEWSRGAASVCGGATKTGLPADPSAERAEIAALEEVLSAAAVRGWLRADRAFRRGNRHVRQLNSSSAACRGLPTLAVPWLQWVRDDPERLFDEDLAVWHKQTKKHRVVEIPLGAASSAPSGRAFFKCIERPGFWQRCLGRFRDSAVRRGWEVGHALLRRGIDTPRPILFVERRKGPRESLKHYLLTESVPASVGLAEFFATRWPGLNNNERRQWLDLHLGQLARQMRRLHDAGFDHRDLKFANMLVADQLADRRIWFLDLDGVRVWRRLPAARAAQNLARITVSALVCGVAGRTDRLRFLKQYLGANDTSDWKCWWRRIGRLSLAKVATNRRRERTLS